MTPFTKALVRPQVGALLFICLGGCDPGAPQNAPLTAFDKVGFANGDTVCVDLIAGQNIDAGDVCMSVGASDLLVTYSTTDGWLLDEVHLWIGTDLGSLPQTKKGNPIPGQFPYTAQPTGETSYTFDIPLSVLGLTGDETSCDPLTFFAAAHATVTKPNADGTWDTQTGWGDGTPITDRGSWGTYFSEVLTCTDAPPVPVACETAFALLGGADTCFLDIDEDGDGHPDFNRWGWTNGPLGEGDYDFDLWAGAAQCDTSKGALAGEVSMTYAGGAAHVEYALTAPGAYLTETHLYVGNDLLPTNNGEFTVAPGQYPYQHDLNGETSDAYDVTGLSGDVYVVAHATVCTESVQ